MKDELISRKLALENICYFCEHKCDAEKHKGTSGCGLRCGSWYSLNSMEAVFAGESNDGAERKERRGK